MKVIREHALILGSILVGYFLFFLPLAYYVIQPLNQTALDALGGGDMAAEHTVFTFSFSSDLNFPNPAHCLEYNYVYDWASESTKQMVDIWKRINLGILVPVLPPILWFSYIRKLDPRIFRRAFFVWLFLTFSPVLIGVGVQSWLWRDVVFGWCSPGPHFQVKGIWPFWPTILLWLLSAGLGIAAIRRVSGLKSEKLDTLANGEGL